MYGPVRMKGAASSSHWRAADVLKGVVLRKAPLHRIAFVWIASHVARVGRPRDEVEARVVGSRVCQRRPERNVLGHAIALEGALDRGRNPTRHPVLRLPVAVRRKALGAL